MWWLALIPLIVLLVIVIVIVVAASSYHDKGDYSDGGGTQVGGNQETHFFMPATDKAGIYGERTANYHIRPLLRNDEYLMANLLLPLKNGRKAEVDCVVISRKGIFCIETKNWVGHIHGNDEDEYWVQKYDDPCRRNREHKNPIKQNEAHCEILDRVLNYRYHVENVVLLVGHEFLLGVDSDCAYTVSQFKNYYRNLGDGDIHEAELKQIYQKLLRYVATEAELEQHKNDVKSRYDT